MPKFHFLENSSNLILCSLLHFSPQESFFFRHKIRSLYKRGKSKTNKQKKNPAGLART